MITNFQHLGVGVLNHHESLKWYYKYFGMDIHLFNEVKDAPLMGIYTGNKTITKQAAMVFNLKGGCGMEVIEAKSFNPSKPNFEVRIGDLGIFAGIIKSADLARHYYKFVCDNIPVSKIGKSPDGLNSFFVKDPNGLMYQVVEHENWFSKSKHFSGGVRGCIVGVSDIDKALVLYKDILGYENIEYDETGVFENWNGFIPGADHKCRRIKLARKYGNSKGFTRIAGTNTIILVQVLNREPRKIFENRYWGDVGFVHIGFDVSDMAKVKSDLTKQGYPFTCDSLEALAMEDVKVHCTYIEDPDGTLIELIDVYKIPVLKKLGVYINAKKHAHDSPIPVMLFKLLKYGKKPYPEIEST